MVKKQNRVQIKPFVAQWLEMARIISVSASLIEHAVAKITTDQKGLSPAIKTDANQLK